MVKTSNGMWFTERVLRQLAAAATLVAVVSCSSRDTLVTAPRVNPAASQIIIPPTNLSISSEAILDSHNSLRRRLGIPPLRWSQRLEAKAAEWVNFLTVEGNCIPRKRGLVGLADYKNGLGENVQRVEPEIYGDGRAEVAAIDENSVLFSWAQQGVDYNYRDNKCRVSKQCGNYTQVVWRDSRVVGCAAASCADNSQIWVCNYDPPGNFLGQKPY